MFQNQQQQSLTIGVLNKIKQTCQFSQSLTPHQIKQYLGILAHQIIQLKLSKAQNKPQPSCQPITLPQIKMQSNDQNLNIQKYAQRTLNNSINHENLEEQIKSIKSSLLKMQAFANRQFKNGVVEIINKLKLIQSKPNIASYIDFGWLQGQTFKIDQNRFTSGHQWMHVYFSTYLKGQFKFTFRVQQLYFSIKIGIASSKNFMEDLRIYLLNDGTVWENKTKVKQTSRFKLGDFVTISGNIQKGKIKFQINNIDEVIYNFKTVRSNWVPYIFLQKKCSISLIEIFHEVNIIPVHIAQSWFDWDEDLLYEINFITIDG